MNLFAQNKKQKRGQRKNRQQPPRGRRSRQVKGDHIIQSTRLSNPSPAIQRFTRTTTQVVSLNPSLGINATNFDLQMSFSLSQTSFYLGGSLLANAANPGASDFTALYDAYRIEAVEVAFIYGTNAYPAAGLTQYQLPIMNIVMDPTDISTISLSSILQYQNLITVQLGNVRTQNGYVLKFSPKPTLSAGANATAAVDINPWLNIDVPTVPYYGLKMFYDNAGSTYNGVIGSLTFYVKYHWAFRLAH